jgi:8-oxo-dGTP pyrophosphatase MutT (NUDIX family)
MLRDRFGTSLTGIRPIDEGELPELAAHVAIPASLVVAVHGDTVLMVFDSWRKQWEIPGGSLEAEETWRDAAHRELFEETGITGVRLGFEVVADLTSVNENRRLLLAIFRTELDALPQLVANPEVEGFRWWNPAEPVADDMSPIDAEIARHVVWRA